ncbi:transcription factor bHLH123-like [Punica granatum]|uniref:Transcription factor bHLH123-like n=2 Tax=Punica granatum TaxID=22663 RepID=A0A6P8E0X1_PUNGR|nr:transcription factor bHLH123-like [Punica granatum]
MADEFHTNGSCWWKGSSKDRLESGSIIPSNFSSSGQQSNMGSLFGWSASCADSVSIISAAADSKVVSSPADWNTNQSSLRVERGEVGFRSMLQENANMEEPSFDMDAAMYSSPSAILQSALQNRSHIGNSYGMNSTTHELLPPLMTRTSPPEQHPHIGHLQFSNNAPFWNASMKGTNVRSSFIPSSSFQCHQQYPVDEKPKNLSDGVNVSNNIGSEASSKRTRNETPSPLPAFKVRKEKMGDRITALQQLVSPFGKTDTASVLSEAIDYIKILHEQVNVLSAPYMKSGTPMHHHQQDKDPEGKEEEEQDLRSRGLCLVPVASTFPVTHEPTGQLDFWTPPFGGPFR